MGRASHTDGRRLVTRRFGRRDMGDVKRNLYDEVADISASLERKKENSLTSLQVREQMMSRRPFVRHRILCQATSNGRNLQRGLDLSLVGEAVPRYIQSSHASLLCQLHLCPYRSIRSRHRHCRRRHHQYDDDLSRAISRRLIHDHPPQQRTSR